MMTRSLTREASAAVCQTLGLVVLDLHNVAASVLHATPDRLRADLHRVAETVGRLKLTLTSRQDVPAVAEAVRVDVPPELPEGQAFVVGG